MKFKSWVDISVLAFISATVLTTVDTILLAIYSIRAGFSDLDRFWGTINRFFFKSWYVGLHIGVIALFAFGFLILLFLKKQKAV